MKGRLPRLATWMSLGVLGLTLALTSTLWSTFDSWVNLQREAVWARLEALAGRPLVYDRIAPNVLAALEFQNVRLLEGDTPVVSVASIRLTLDWEKILQGRWTQAFSRIQLINVRVDLDSRRDQDLIDHWRSLGRGGTSSPGASFEGLQIEGFNLKARWTDGTQALSLDRGFALLTSQDGRWNLKYRGALAWDDVSHAGWASLSVRGELNADAGFENLSLRAEASLVKTAWFDLQPVGIQINVTPEEVTFAKVADRIPLDLQASWDRGTTWVFQAVAENFRPSRLVRVKLSPEVAGLAEGLITGRFSYQWGGDFTFEGSGSWPAGSWPKPLDQGPVQAQGRVKTEAGLYWFEDFHFDAAGVRAGFSGSVDPRSWLPSGDLVLESWNLEGLGVARGALTLTRGAQRVDVQGIDLAWNDLSSTNPSGWVARSGRNWDFVFEGPWDGTQGRFSVEGSVDPGASRVNLTAGVTGFPLGLAATEVERHFAGLAVPPMVKSLVLEAGAHVALSPKSVEISDAFFNVHDPETDGRRAQGTVSWDRGHLAVNVDELTWDGFRSWFQAEADFFDQGQIDWSAETELWGRHFLVSGRWSADQTLVFSGTPGLSGTLWEGRPGVWVAGLKVDPLEVVPGWTVATRLRAEFGSVPWSVEVEDLSVTGVYPWNHQPLTLNAKASIDPQRVVSRLVLRDSLGTLQGSLDSSWSMDWSSPWKGQGSLGTEGVGKETLWAQWTIEGPQSAQLSLRGAGLDLQRASVADLQGRLTFDSSFELRGDQLAWSAQTSLSEARWDEAPLGFRGTFRGQGNRVTAQGINLSLSPLRVLDGTLDWDASTGNWSSTLGLGLKFGPGDWESRWAAQGSWPTSVEQPKTFRIRSTKNTWIKKAFPDWAVSGSWGAEAWAASLENGGLSGEGRGDGTFLVQAQAPFPIQGRATGSWKSSDFRVDISGLKADFGLVKDLINTAAFSLTAGVVEGDLTLEGSPVDPDFHGNLLVRGLQATSSFVRVPIGPLDVPVVLEGHRLRFDPVNAGPQGKTWLVSGALLFDRLVPEEYQFTIQTDPLSTIPFSYRHTGISASGETTGLFIIRGTPLAVSLGGRLVLQDTTITLRESRAQGEGRGPGFNVDLNLITGRKVEFLWPNESLPLLRAVTAPNQSLAIKANDVASTWSLTGKLALRAGEINYLNRTFVLKEGQLQFQESQSGFDPRINVRAEWKLRETTGTTTVNLRADGTLSNFSPRFDAVPFKSADELQRLVGTTLALPTDYTSTSVEAGLSVASDVGTSFLLAPFEEAVKRNFGLDLFTVKTEILKKTILNRNDLVDASDYLDNTRLFFGKYIGDDLFLQGTLAFRQDGSAASSPMVVEPEFQMEFQTPFFLLNWTLLPQHPETLFVTDNTVTFRWNWSY